MPASKYRYHGASPLKEGSEMTIKAIGIVFIIKPVSVITFGAIFIGTSVMTNSHHGFSTHYSSRVSGGDLYSY